MKHYYTKLEQLGIRSSRILLLVVALMFSSISMAQIEIDGNAVSNGGDDWEQVYLGTSSADVTTGVIPDASGVSDNTYTGGSTKDFNDFDQWLWEYKGSSDKTDLLHGGAALYGDRIYFFGDRFANDGATFIGFWLLQNKITKIEPVGTSPGTFVGNHEIGDVLVVAEIKNGGAVAEIAAYSWEGPGGGTEPNPANSLQPITIGPGGSLGAVVNANFETAPWPFEAKGYAPGEFPPIIFFEGFIDIGALGLAQDACFSSFIAINSSGFIERNISFPCLLLYSGYYLYILLLNRHLHQLRHLK